MSDKTTNERYLKVTVSLAPKTNGKKFAKWCEETGFTPLGSERRAWSSGLSTYLRGADGIAFNDGEPFLYYEEDAIDIEALVTEAELKGFKAGEKSVVTLKQLERNRVNER